MLNLRNIPKLVREETFIGLFDLEIMKSGNEDLIADGVFSIDNNDEKFMDLPPPEPLRRMFTNAHLPADKPDEEIKSIRNYDYPDGPLLSNKEAREHIARLNERLSVSVENIGQKNGILTKEQREIILLDNEIMEEIEFYENEIIIDEFYQEKYGKKTENPEHDNTNLISISRDYLEELINENKFLKEKLVRILEMN
jgi:hypothetical protein